MVINSTFGWRYCDTPDARGGRDNRGCRPRCRVHWCRATARANSSLMMSAEYRMIVILMLPRCGRIFPGTAARVISAPVNRPAGRSYLTVAPARSGLARGPAISDKFSSRANRFSSRARRRSAHLTIGDFHARPWPFGTSPRLAPFRDMSKVRGEPDIWYCYTSG